MRRPERRIVRGDGTGYASADDAERAAETFREGQRLIAEARSRFGLSRRDGFTCWRGSDGRPLIKDIRPAPPLAPEDELAEARCELLRARAAMFTGGPR